LKYLRGCCQQQGFTLVKRGVTWAVGLQTVARCERNRDWTPLYLYYSRL